MGTGEDHSARCSIFIKINFHYYIRVNRRIKGFYSRREWGNMGANLLFASDYPIKISHSLDTRFAAKFHHFSSNVPAWRV